MKSPLKYLAGLMGRGRGAEPPQALIDQDPKPKHLVEAQATLETSVSALERRAISVQRIQFGGNNSSTPVA